jgi:hypothetical protein
VKVFILSVVQVFLNKVFKIPELPNEILAAFGFWDYFKLIFPTSFVLGMGFLLVYSQKIRSKILGNTVSTGDGLSNVLGLFAFLLLGAAYLTYWLFPDKYPLFQEMSEIIPYIDPKDIPKDSYLRPRTVYQNNGIALLVNIIYTHYRIIGIFNFILTFILAILIADYSHSKIMKWMD